VAIGGEAGLQLPLAAATKLQYDRMGAPGLGQLDKSGIAELTFKNRRGCLSQMELSQGCSRTIRKFRK
jgi:3-hydroxyisobutyrate dehydrogenase